MRYLVLPVIVRDPFSRCGMVRHAVFDSVSGFQVGIWLSTRELAQQACDHRNSHGVLRA